MAKPTLSGVSDLGRVESEEVTINNNLFTYPIPSASTNLTVQGNMLGKTRTIEINGTKEGTDTEINAFIQDIEDWVNNSGVGKFQSNRVYTDSFGNSYTVLGRVFEWTRRRNNQNKIDFDMEMVEGKAINNIVIGDLI